MRGGIAGLAGGAVGAAIPGGLGSFIGGATGSGLGTHLNRGESSDVWRSALIGGGMAFSMYHASAQIRFSKKTGNDEYDNFPNKVKYKLSKIQQLQSAYKREFGFTMDGEYGMSKIVGKGARDLKNVKNTKINRWLYKGTEEKSRIYVEGKERLFVWGKRNPNSVDMTDITEKGVTKYSFHSHKQGPLAHFFSDADFDVSSRFEIPHNYMVNYTQTHYHNLAGEPSRVGFTNFILMRSVWGF